MSDRSDHHLPAANDAALDLTGSQRTNTDSDQQPNSPLPESSGPASLYGEHPLLSPSSRFVTEPTDASLQPQLTRNPETSLAFGIPSTSEQSLMPAGPSTSSRQLLQSTAASSPFRRSDDIADMPRGNSGSESISESGHPSAYSPPSLSSVRGHGLTSSWQSPLGENEPQNWIPDIGGNSVSLDAFKTTQRPSSDVSLDNLFQISFASEADLENLAHIYGHMAMSDPLSNCSFQQGPDNIDIDHHIEVGRFLYRQAFAANSEAVVFKATNQNSGEIVGCAWLQPHAFLEDCWETNPFCQPGFKIPPSLDQKFYSYVHDVQQIQRELVAKPFGRGIFKLRHYSIRSLDISYFSLSLDERSKVYEDLVSSITSFEPGFDIYASVSDFYPSYFETFLSLKWEKVWQVVIKPNKCPKGIDKGLRKCSIDARTLNGLMRARTRVSVPAWPEPTAETWRPTEPPTTGKPAMPVGSEESSTELAQQVQQPEQSQPPAQASGRGKKTITVNFLPDGYRPFDYTSIERRAFTYLSYRNISVKTTVGDLIQNFRLQNSAMKGVCKMSRHGPHGWKSGPIYLMNEKWKVEKTLRDLNWGYWSGDIWFTVEE